MDPYSGEGSAVIGPTYSKTLPMHSDPSETPEMLRKYSRVLHHRSLSSSTNPCYIKLAAVAYPLYKVKDAFNIKLPTLRPRDKPSLLGLIKELILAALRHVAPGTPASYHVTFLHLVTDDNDECM